jgi:hypothetical protein
MRKSTINLFGSEWFGIAISTLALAQVYILIFGQFHNILLRYVAESFTIIGLGIFVIIFSIWIVRGFVIRDGGIFTLE